MAAAKLGDEVRVHYTGRLGDGTVFDSSEDGEPLSFKLGAGQVIPGFDQAVIGMSLGDAKTVTIPAGDAYGERRQELITQLDRQDVPSDLDIEVGQRFQLERDSGEKVRVTVTGLTDQDVTLDANHPLAGQDLTFDIKLVDVAK
jgi:peptidylprolyl isomerase